MEQKNIFFASLMASETVDPIDWSRPHHTAILVTWTSGHLLSLRE